MHSILYVNGRAELETRTALELLAAHDAAVGGDADVLLDEQVRVAVQATRARLLVHSAASPRRRRRLLCPREWCACASSTRADRGRLRGRVEHRRHGHRRERAAGRLRRERLERGRSASRG